MPKFKVLVEGVEVNGSAAEVGSEVELTAEEGAALVAEAKVEEVVETAAQ